MLQSQCYGVLDEVSTVTSGAYRDVFLCSRDGDAKNAAIGLS